MRQSVLVFSTLLVKCNRRFMSQTGKVIRQPTTRERLRDIYPTKSPRDFEVLKSAVRVKFHGGIKLNVDVTPIIRNSSLGIENGGWIPRSDEWRLTSVTCHNEFVRSRTARSKQRPGPVKFNRLVRLVKWWNNLQDDLAQPSYFCDLIYDGSPELGVGGR